jgi:membrane-bound serine protease (ClpP class)
MMVALVAAGVVMVLAEVLVPGGVVGAIGVLALAAGVVLGFMKDPALGFGLMIGSIVFGVVVFWLWVKYFPQSPLGRKVFLSEHAHDWHTYDEETGGLVGAEGLSHTPLRPSGIAQVDGKRVDVVTRGEMIAQNTRIRVVSVNGNRVVVEAVEDPEEATE